MNVLTNQINSYVAVLIVTIFGAFAALIIIHVAERASEASLAGVYVSAELSN